MQSYSWTSTCASGTTSKISPNLHVCNFINILCCVDQHRTQQPCWGRNVKRICRMTVCNKLAEAFVLRWVHPVCLDSGSLWIWLLCQRVLPPPPTSLSILQPRICLWRPKSTCADSSVSKKYVNIWLSSFLQPWHIWCNFSHRFFYNF